MGGRITVVMLGEPTPKGRPRFTRSGRVYTPEATLFAERTLGWEAKTQTQLDEPMTCPLSVGMLFVVSPQRRGRKPDLDNFVKLVWDALNAVIWKDDSQIVEMHARLERGDEPRTEVEIQEVAS